MDEIDWLSFTILNGIARLPARRSSAPDGVTPIGLSEPNRGVRTHGDPRDGTHSSSGMPADAAAEVRAVERACIQRRARVAFDARGRGPGSRFCLRRRSDASRRRPLFGIAACRHGDDRPGRQAVTIRRHPQGRPYMIHRVTRPEVIAGPWASSSRSRSPRTSPADARALPEPIWADPDRGRGRGRRTLSASDCRSAPSVRVPASRRSRAATSRRSSWTRLDTRPRV